MKMLLGSARMERIERLVSRNVSMMKSCRPDVERVREPNRLKKRSPTPDPGVRTPR